MPSKPRTKKQHAATMRNWTLYTMRGVSCQIKAHAKQLLTPAEYTDFIYLLELMDDRLSAKNKEASDVRS